MTATITATPADAGAGTVVQRLTVTVRVTPAISLVRAGSGDLSVPDCSPIPLFYDVAADAGPATWAVSALSSLDVTIDGRHVATNGVPVTPPVTATGRGTAMLQITPTAPLAGDTLVAITLLGEASDAGDGRRALSLGPEPAGAPARAADGVGHVGPDAPGAPPGDDDPPERRPPLHDRDEPGALRQRPGARADHLVRRRPR